MALAGVFAAGACERCRQAREPFQALAGEVVAWEANPGDSQRLDAIFRFFHTVKGSCGFLDLPRLSRVFLAYPGRARGRTVQRLGRLMRPHAEKTDAALFDFVDRKVPLLRRHHLERRKLYAEVLGVPASKLGTRKGAA